MRSGARRNLFALALALALIALGGWWINREQERREQEALETCQHRMSSVGEALNQYCNQRWGNFYPHRLEALVPRFIDRLPRCPTTPDKDYDYQRYSDVGAGYDYLLSCPGHHRGVPEGFPKMHTVLEYPVTTLKAFEALGHPGAPPNVFRDPTPADFEPDFEPLPKEHPYHGLF